MPEIQNLFSNPMTPSDFLVYVSKHVPASVWAKIDFLRSEKGKDLPNWPPYVFLPFSAWYEVICEFVGKETFFEDEIDRDFLQALVVAGTWRVTQDIVRFDPDVYASILDTPLTGDIPYDIFYRMPAWCVWVETRGMVWHYQPITGFWAMLNHSFKDNCDQLYLYFYTGKALKSYPATLRFGGGSVRDGLMRWEKSINGDRLNSVATRYFSEVASAGCVEQAINLLLYICAYGFHGSDGEDGSVEPRRPEASKTKKGWRLYPAKRVTYHMLGEDIGLAIRAHAEKTASAHGMHAGPRPHVRRAHWHGYWYGPKKAEASDKNSKRCFKLRWLPPIPVAMSEESDPNVQDSSGN